MGLNVYFTASSIYTDMVFWGFMNGFPLLFSQAPNTLYHMALIVNVIITTNQYKSMLIDKLAREYIHRKAFKSI